MSDADCTIFECPKCQSRRAAIVASSPPSAKCAACGTRYPITTLPDPDDINPLKLGRGKNKKKRTAAPGVRHRRDNGPEELEVTPVPPPSPAQLGTLHLHTESLISSGPDALVRATHEAAKLSKKFGEEIEARWCLPTEWLYQLGLTHRARAQYALAWRPRFLAVVALSRSIVLGCRAAKVSRPTVNLHRRNDPDFDAQVIAAQEHAVELLHDVAMPRALEGDCEPIFWQGIEVGHVRKFDGRLQIEMLRAHLPNKFKTPGSKQPLISGDGNQVLVIDAATRAELVRLRQEALHAMALKIDNGQALTGQMAGQVVERDRSNGRSADSGNSPSGV